MKAFIKKYHLIAYLITMAVVAVVGLSVKWYQYGYFSTVYGGTLGSAYRFYNIFLALVLVAVSILFYVLVIRRPGAATAFLTISLTVGTLFAFLMPVNSAADEDKHMFAVTELSNGMLGIKDNNTEYFATYRKCDAESGFTRYISIGNFKLMGEKLFDRTDTDTYVDYEVEHFGYAKATAILYSPAIIGVVVAKKIGLGTIMMYYLARILILTLYSLIGFLAINKIPTGKNILAIIMALPTSLSRAACVSQDGILHACIFLFMAYAIKFAFSGEIIKPKEVVVAVLAAMGMIVGKGGAYLPLLILLFLIPKENFGRAKYFAVILISIVFALLVFVISNPGLLTDIARSGAGNNYDLAWSEEQNYSIKYLITHPGVTVKMFFATILGCGGMFFGDMISGGFGWLEISSSPLVVSGLFLILMMTAFSENGNTVVFTKKQRTITCISVVAAVFLVVLSMWVFWTPISYDYIAGLQGRYFIVFLLPIMLMLRNNRFVIKKDFSKNSMVIMAAIEVFALFEIWTKISI